MKKFKLDASSRTIDGIIEPISEFSTESEAFVKLGEEGLNLICLTVECPSIVEQGTKSVGALRISFGKDCSIYVSSESIDSATCDWKITFLEDERSVVESFKKVVTVLNASAMCKLIIDDITRLRIEVFARQAEITSIPDIPVFILHMYHFLGEIEREDFLTTGRVPKCILSRARVNKSHHVQHPDMAATLYTYQADCVDWMLEREGIRIDENGLTFPIPVPAIPMSVPIGNSLDLNLMDFQLNINNGNQQPIEEIRGGLLNDEMGLGKTLMMLSLVLLNPLTASSHLSAASKGLFVAKSTVIITPSTILYQWIAELKHTPKLTYLIYEGQEVDEEGIPIDQAYISQYDIIFTTYQFLQKEFYKALPPPTRSRRKEQKYVRKPSIFGDTYFYRVVLDEAQMVERIHSNSTKMAGMIKREISWGVTGTPCPRTGLVHDMRGLFDFIKSSFSAPNSPSFYDSLPEPILANVLKTFTHRNSKQNVENELTLPEQRDSTFKLHLNAIEDQYYNDSLEEALKNVMVKPLLPCNINDKREMNSYHSQVSARLRAMETWFIRLRKICCHPRIGSSKRKVGAETMQDVVESMLQRTSSDLHNSGRQLVLNFIYEGQLLEKEEDYANAIGIYKKQLPGVRSRIKELHSEMTEDAEKVESLENAKIHFNLWKEMEHRLCFFIAGASHQIEDKDSEDEYYQLAEEIRKQLLHDSMKGVERHSQITMDFYNKNTPMLQKELLHPVELSGGIYSRDIFTCIEAIEDKLNDQIEIIFSWRDEIKSLLMEPLDEQNTDEGPTGEEFAAGVILQEKCMAYQDELTTLIQYRRDTLLFDPKEYAKCDSCSIVIAQGHIADCSHQFCDKCKAGFVPGIEGICPCPICLEDIVIANMETQSFTSNYRKQPSALIRNELQRKLRSDVAHLALGATENSYKTLTLKLKSISRNGSLISQERRLATIACEHLSSQLEIQAKHLKCLESELDHFNNLYNARIKYFKQLNAISDTVELMEFDRPVEEVREDLKVSSKELQAKITSLVGRKRYLAYLAAEGNTQANNAHRTCGICHNDVEKGVLTNCGHLACDSCTGKWVMKMKKCTVCNSHVGLDSLVSVTFKPKKMTKNLVTHQESEFVEMLKKIELVESYGTKFDMIVRHIKFLIQQNPTVKVLCFSQWDDVLKILGEALKQQDIGWISLEGKGWDPVLGKPLGVQRKGQSVTKFINSSSVSCFMLHAKSHSAGLTLVAATHVFLIEPFLYKGYEQQALARVHRIGQTKPTFVWRYIISDTVEEALVSANIGNSSEVQKLGTRDSGEVIDGEFLDQFFQNLIEKETNSQ